jgi:hypothetical protein
MGEFVFVQANAAQQVKTDPRKHLLTVSMGDTAQSDILVYARVDIAAAMIITLPDPRTTRMVIENIRLAPPGSHHRPRPLQHLALGARKSRCRPRGRRGKRRGHILGTENVRRFFPTDLIWFWPVD